MTQPCLSPEERALLLSYARATIASAARGEPPPSLDAVELSPRLTSPGAAFVTLHTRDGALRGCIGSLIAHRPLIEDVQANALAAAFKDPRFPPVTTRELPDLCIEISVLSSPQPLQYDGPDDLLDKLRPGIDGVVIEKGPHRATFLPQVWEQLPDAREFLMHLCYKAGLPVDAWQHANLRVSTYQVEEFSESV